MWKTRLRLLWQTLFIALIGVAQGAVATAAAVSVIDDAQHIVKLDAPARRIISLAPHATELLFDAGAGSYIVGISDYSDYPEQAKKITSVGNIFALDLERLLSLKPDLIVVWGTGNGSALADKLRNTKIAVFESEPRSLEMIATTIERLSVLSGSRQIGQTTANQVRQRVSALRTTYQRRDHQRASAPINVFYQISARPLMTINDQHLISEAIQLCGGRNIFGKLPVLSPTINVEAVLAANPDVIVAAGKETSNSLEQWRRYPQLNAVNKAHLFTVNADWINRPTSRFLDATEQLCRELASIK